MTTPRTGLAETRAAAGNARPPRPSLPPPPNKSPPLHAWHRFSCSSPGA